MVRKGKRIGEERREGAAWERRINRELIGAGRKDRSKEEMKELRDGLEKGWMAGKKEC